MISLILFSITAILWALRESTYHGKIKFKGEFFNQKAWMNKYKSPLQPAPKNLYYRVVKITYLERWPGSATILVTFTDFIHTSQFVIKLLLVSCIMFYKPMYWFDPLLFWVAWGILFTVAYRLASK